MPRALGSSAEVTIALSRVGELLASEGQAFAIAIIGGAALLLTGAIGRSTTDVDVIAVGAQGPLGLDLKTSAKSPA
jgi:hypothetical protein